jgi:hypothetical protein
VSEETIGELYDRLTSGERRRLFFAFWAAVEFYASGDTWFAVALIPDRPAGMIIDDFAHCDDLGRPAPGKRARRVLGRAIKALGRRSRATKDGAP